LVATTSFVDRQAHHAGDVAGADIAEVPRRDRERDLLIVRAGRLQVAAEVVHHLRHHARPVDRIDGADLVAGLEFEVVRHRLDHVLAIVEHAFDGDVEDVRILQAEHLRGLEGAHLGVRRQHEDADAALAAHRVLGRAAGVARGGAEDVQLIVVLRQRVLEQVPEQLHRHVLEGQGRAVRQALQDQLSPVALFQHAQRRDLAARLVGARVAVDLGRVGLAGQRLQVGVGDVGGELAQDLVGEIGVGQLRQASSSAPLTCGYSAGRYSPPSGARPPSRMSEKRWGLRAADALVARVDT
jgi:hypothetical protein